ncbi:MAG: carbohydrate ABC transporter permease [Elusimicrobia bacterium]|nr:carbohydrate ABC transporter permease [Elusimicrobiota bacterium]
MSQKQRKQSSKFLFFGAVALVCFWSLAPFLWQVLTSLKSSEEVIASPPVYWPSRLTIVSYFKIFSARPFSVYIWNSLIVAFGTTFLCTGVAALAAYAFSRLKLPGGKAVSNAILLVSLFPPTLLVVALKQLIQTAGLLNNPLSLILTYAALNLPFAIWVLANFFKQVPMDIEEAAQVDGLGRWSVLWKIVAPLSAPAIATTAILVFIFSWNEFLLALTFMSKDAARTVPVGIAMLSGVTIYEIPWDQISAAVVITTLPVVAMVLAFQRRIIEGLTAGAVKG